MLDPTFLDRVAPYDVRLPSRHIQLPITYRDVQAIVGAFSIDARTAASALPGGLHPVRVTPRRAVLAVACFDYRDSSVGAYGEVAVGILAATRRLPPLVGVLAERRLRDVGVFVRHLPVTTEIALEAGRAIWGYPKFLADIRFGDAGHTCDLAVDGVRILKLTVRDGGRLRERSRAFRSYSVRDGKLLRTAFFTQSEEHESHASGAATLELGPHAIAREIESWSPTLASIEARFVARMQSILPAAEWVGVTGSPADPIRAFAATEALPDRLRP